MTARRRLLALSILAFAASPSALWTQRAVGVTGVVFDSLRLAPLAGAFVMIVGTERNATTDARGRFHFDTLPPGKYMVFVQHAALDSIGLNEWSAPIEVRPGVDTIRLNLPSFLNLWRASCGIGDPSPNVQFIFGTVRAVGRTEPVAGATVAANWTEVVPDEKTGIRQNRVGGSVRTNGAGGYLICDIPRGVALRIAATADSASTGALDVGSSPVRVQRRDLLLGFAGDSSARGIIAGVVLDNDGHPLASARVGTDEVPEIRTNAAGEFVLRGVPSGTRQVTALSIGAAPTQAIVDVLPHDTARVSLRLPKATVLDAVKVKAANVRERWVQDIDDRRKLGAGHFLDSTQVERHADALSALSQLPHYPCVSVLWMDGLKFVGKAEINRTVHLMSPSEIGVVEWYERGTPPQFGREKCTLVVWTKRRLPH